MKQKMKTLGRHLIAEFYGCNVEMLDDVSMIRRALLEASEEVGVTVLQEAFHRYEPIGVSGVLLLAESHFSVHTWPEAGYAAVDIYTCGDLEPRAGIVYLKRALEAASVSVQEIVRGLASEVRGVLKPEDVRTEIFAVAPGAPDA